MAELTEISLRNVGPEQIYDSYMGILRISPTDLDGSYVDSMSIALTNPKLNENGKNGDDREIILSDSDGIKLGITFKLRVRETDVVDANGNATKENVINVVTHSDRDLFATKGLHVRSTLIVNKEEQSDKVMPVQIYHQSPYYADSFDVLGYPIDSPHDGSYFNTGNSKSLIDYKSSVDVRTQLTEALYKKDKKWYDKEVPGSERVKVADKFVYTQNINYEQVPIVYTHDYVLGHYTNHTAHVTDEIKTKYLGTAIGPDKLDATGSKSLFTKLSFIQLDKLVWDVVSEAAQGYIRHTEGRYTRLGIGMNESISERLFGQINPPSTASPLIGLGVSPGIVLYHAMPFHRFMFHVLRQEVRNSADENNDYKNLRSKVKQYVQDGKITAIGKQDPGFVNQLTKEFVLCDGKTLTYDNYPSVNTDNPDMFELTEQGIAKRENGGKPTAAKTKTDAYTAIGNSVGSKNGNSVKTPSLLAFDQQAPRYIRGLNWTTVGGVETPLQYESELQSDHFSKNDKEHEVVKGKDYGKTKKNFDSAGLYRMGVDWAAQENRHKHLCFYNSKTNNRSGAGTSVGVGIGTYQETVYITFRRWSKLKIPRTVTVTAIKPYKWNSQASYDSIPDKEMLMKYSFSKHKLVNGRYLPNTISGHTPIPSAGLWAWKIEKSNGSVHNDSTNGFVIQNAAQTPISSDVTKRNAQLEMINAAEGAAPIADKGGCLGKGLGKQVYVHCEKRKNTGHHNRLKHWVTPDVGGYVLQKAIENDDKEVPRFVTSLPHPNIEKEQTEPEDPFTMEMGGKTITPDTSLSYPPSVCLIPLFKI